MRLVLPLTIAICMLTACTTVELTDRYGRRYDSYEAYVTRARSVNEDILAQLPTLQAPLGRSALIVIPTRERLQALADASYIGPEQYRNDPTVLSVINNRFAYNEMVWTYLPRYIERRGIFETISTIRADRLDEITTPAGGYLIWGERHPVGDAQSDFFHAIADGETDMITLPDSYLLGTDEYDSTRRLLVLIEHFVKAHRPSNSATDNVEPP